MTLATRSLDLRLRHRTRFGLGSVLELPGLVREAGGRRAFVVTDPGVSASGVADRVEEALSAAGLELQRWAGVEGNPGAATITDGSAALRAFGLAETVVVPVGGGSSIDTAKVVSLHAANPHRAVMALGYDDRTIAPGLPLVAIPTTAGTGAETNTYGVITDETVGRKGYVGHPSVLPVATILDPELTLGLPAAPTAATGVDALTHALESLLSRNPNPFAEAIALHVVRTVAAWLPRAVGDGSDLEARSQMLLAAHLAGIGQASGTGVGLVHAIGHALGTRGRLAHGTALAAVMPEVLDFYGPLRHRELALVGVALGVASPADAEAVAARAAIDALERFLAGLGQRRTLRELGLEGETLEAVADDAQADPAISSAPRLPDGGELRAILASVAG